MELSGSKKKYVLSALVVLGLVFLWSKIDKSWTPPSQPTKTEKISEKKYYKRKRYVW